MNHETKVIVAAPTFQAVFQTAMCEQIKKLFKPEEMVLRSVTDDADVQRERLERALLQVHPVAMIAISIRPDPHTIAAYTAESIPIVLIDEEAADVSNVITDNYKGGRIAGEYLISKGRKKIAIVSGRTQVKGGYNAEQRVKGFLQVLSDAGLSVPQGCMIEVPHYSQEDGIEVMPKLLDAGVDAIFCAAGDNCAIGLLTVAKEHGVKIPEDVAIVGFDDLLIAQISTPKLTTVRQPMEKIAHTAYKMAMVDGAEILHKPQKVIFDPELVIRQSA
jgi:DNA-binding LacI/PurR family transcriptional regulator